MCAAQLSVSVDLDSLDAFFMFLAGLPLNVPQSKEAVSSVWKGNFLKCLIG